MIIEDLWIRQGNLNGIFNFGMEEFEMAFSCCWQRIHWNCGFFPFLAAQIPVFFGSEIFISLRKMEHYYATFDLCSSRRMEYRIQLKTD